MPARSYPTARLGDDEDDYHGDSPATRTGGSRTPTPLRHGHGSLQKAR